MEPATAMLTDTQPAYLNLKEKLYWVNNNDALYVAVTAAGFISFHYNHSINVEVFKMGCVTCGGRGILIAACFSLTKKRKSLST